MKKILILSAALVMAAVLAACGAPAGNGTAPVDDTAAEQAKVNTITAELAYERMQSGDPIVVVDVRTAEEYAEKHIEGAILIPNEDIGTTQPAELPLLDTEILVYCRSGNRSAQAAEKLLKMGYTNVSDFGGINDWTYETVAGEWAAPEKEGTLTSFMSYDLDGMPVDEAVFADHKLTMINIWATFCGPCLREMPELGELNEAYSDKGVQVIGIVSDVLNSDATIAQSKVEKARSLVEQTGASYLHLLPTPDLITAKLQYVSAVPETIFVDSEGKIVGESYLGARSGSDWAEIIDGLLAEMEA